ncbi:MmgE/PrpD family protein [Methylobacterium sp. E-066]|uniref:MmgE/PrpD family protein n=1 Tax=Methylobacterium sp. E-066 TaxID=2836584 RepID=UPI001FB90B6A|nr:MmgE/PrpD family protein [Methylobacterium sp. E-066]MCJ2144784.1 MmgE/PrpD family protein [Methylobacterium sp. E-066]
MSLTRALGQFVADLSPDGVPEEAARIARMGFIDCIGVLIAGRHEDAPRLLQDTLDPGPGSSSLLFTDRTASAADAALINGTAAHALDFDDVALRGHPSTVLVPAILAEAEALGASGRDMVAAYLAGYETWAELVGRDRGFHHGKGWHPTGIFGAIGAAAACASLRRLDPVRAATALALGASQSAGLMANFGTMTKPFHAGRSAQSGVIAARLAAAGFTANLDALEHPQGYLAAVSPAGDVNRETPPARLGDDWHVLKTGLNIKKYPACYCTHRAIDGMIDLARAERLRAADVEGITVHLSENYATILRNHRPETGLAAKFSIEFALASSIVANRVGLTELTDDFVRGSDVQALIRSVTVETTSAYDPDQPGAALADWSRVQLKSGGSLETEHVARARGHADNPLRDEELFAKFENCLEAGRSVVAPAVLFDRLQRMDGAPARAITAIH